MNEGDHNPMETKQRIFIAVPCYDQRVNCQLMPLFMYWAETYSIELVFCWNTRPLVSARNKLVKQFLNTDCSHILFIDDDIVPPKEALDKLLEADKDIICPVCFMGKEFIEKDMIVPMPAITRTMENGDRKIVYGKGVEEVDTITGGCFLVKRGVFESGQRLLFRINFNEEGKRINSGDILFSDDAKERGYKLYAHFDILCSHFRPLNLLQINNLVNAITGGKEVKLCL